MDHWFTVEAITQDTFAISEWKHWEESHCYLVCGTKRAILIDTGLGIANIREVVTSLTSLPILVVTTHAHWDHIGGHSYFDTIAIHEAEKDWLSGSFPLSLKVVKQNITCPPCDFPHDFVIDQYRIYQGVPQRILHDGDRLDLGNRYLLVIHTPGHSPGHCCFYEPERQFLYTGDLIYLGCLDAFYPTTNPQLFWQSIQRVQTLAIRHIWPGHHQLMVPVNIIGRIEQAFRALAVRGKLEQGSGVFSFGDFQIHI